MTLGSAAADLKKNESPTLTKAADIAASAMLRGARGNSGVILSLLFRGVAKHLKKAADPAGGMDLALALSEGVRAAYKAVMKPAEGTILTVSRVSAQHALELCQSNPEIGCDVVLDEVIRSAEEALAETQHQNPVLEKAGVVDAGGFGYIAVLKGMRDAYHGTQKEHKQAEAEQPTGGVFSEIRDEDITFTYCTEFIAERRDRSRNVQRLRSFLSTIGDSLVIGEDDEAFKVHVHTNIPGEALTKSQSYGTLELAKIENMRTQHEDILAGKKAQSTDDLEEIEKELECADAPAAPEKRCGVVAICAGEGMAQLFREIGADTIVTGGQTMNPSTEDILKEINRTPAEVVFVLPNNKNIIMAAEQSIPLCEDKTVVVIPTKTVPQGITALLNFDPDKEISDIAEAMNESIESVHTAQVTYAARDSDFDGYAIHAGEYLALLDGKLIGSFTEMSKMLGKMGEVFEPLDPELITVYYGENVTQDEAEETAAALEDRFPDAEVTVVNGGQPVYYYMISIE